MFAPALLSLEMLAYEDSQAIFWLLARVAPSLPLSAKMSSGMMFCPECNNMLQPKEDRQRQQLKFLCRRCDFFRYAEPTYEENCVDRINFSYKSKEDMMISPDLSQDPTLGRVPDWRCPACGNLGCVFFQLPERVAEDAMTLVYVCTKSGCGHSVKQDATQDLDADADDSPHAVGRVKSGGLPQVKQPPPDEAEAEPQPEAVVSEEAKGKDDEVDAEGDADLFGEDQDQGFGFNNELEEEIAQNDEFDRGIAENELEQEIALEGGEDDNNFGFGSVQV
ncbi:DNA-directed rna polymerase II subunit, putative [Eimeria brunetti]|uniref:DNA-directed rna polymerase II subunit, putative n=1 Tax=Eimeria brunetti TaxID=51314 RepID=U6LG66_9EIME|nr:DNA-directed rna polymerase II subunit, putative [Eimeria brunetti]